jgi:hypothetical protein
MAASPTLPSIDLEEIARIYPGEVAGGEGATRPEFGQLWPRGNTRGNA